MALDVEAQVADKGSLLLVSVCICTFRRPSLNQTLESIRRQILPKKTSIEIVVVDNDKAGSAGNIARNFQDTTNIPVRYEIEPIQNIALARNQAIAIAQGEWFAFLDDDEAAEPDWISTLLAAGARHKADIVAGSVRPVYDPSVPDWIKKSDVFEKRRPPAGTELEYVSTCNVLVRSRPLLELDSYFDASYGLTGGEDAELFRRMVNGGARAVSCPEAVVVEHVPQERATLRYMVRRALGAGENEARIARAEGGRIAAVAGLPASIIKFAVLASICAVQSFKGRSKSLPTLLRAVLHLGRLRAFCGVEPRQTYAEHPPKPAE